MRKNVRIDDGNCRTADKYKLANFHLITRHGKVYGPRADGRPAAANLPPSPPPPPLAHPPFCRPLFAAPRRPAANNRIRYVNLYISTFAHPVSLFSSLFPRPRSCQTGGDWGLRGSTANSATTGAMPRQRRRNRARRQIRKDRENGEKTARRGRKRERERERERINYKRRGTKRK